MKDTIGIRILQIIKEKGLKKVEFARIIKVDQAYVTQLTSGKRNPSDRLIDSICREFGVNETWLRTGEGEPYIPKDRETRLADAVNRLLSGENPEFKRRLILVLSALDESQWAFLEEKLLEIVGGREIADPAASGVPDETEEERLERETREEAEEYYRLRLEERKAIRDSEAKQTGTPRNSDSYGDTGGVA